MNIFVLDSEPMLAASMMCDEHIRKMPVESLQMLSTAHRMLDGVKTAFKRPNGKVQYIMLMPGEECTVQRFKDDGTPIDIGSQKYVIIDPVIYRATHENSPPVVWTRETSANYDWHYELFCAMLDEYTNRTGQFHACEWGRSWMRERPKNITIGAMTDQPLVMPEQYFRDTVVESYREFYRNDKPFASWKHSAKPEWMGK